MLAMPFIAAPLYTIIDRFKIYISSLKWQGKHTPIPVAERIHYALANYRGATNPSKAHAIDILSTPVMLTDNQFVITYANMSCREWMKKHSLHLPGSSGQLTGLPFDTVRDANPRLGCTMTLLRNHRGEFEGAFIDLHIN